MLYYDWVVCLAQFGDDICEDNRSDIENYYFDWLYSA